MKRRELMLAALTAPALGLPLLARAHHGWGSFDQDRPIYLEGRVTRSRWQNPHAAQLASAANARAVMSSTLPVPLMARYFGAAAGSALAQLP
jgi:hypothetical protein